MSSDGIAFLILLGTVCALIVSAEVVGDKRTLDWVCRLLCLAAGFILFDWLFR